MYARSLHSPKIFVSSRGSIDCMDAGLVSAKGASEIIASICSRRTVSQLILSHNTLGDDGCALLFEFLSLDSGRKYRVEKISLNSNGIGDKGLAAIAKYLKGDSSLKELFLQNNNFTCADTSLASSFAAAVNYSRLEVLTLTTNPRLSDAFADNFLPTLDSASLKELHFSAMGLTPRAVPSLVEYISSRRCRLQTLKLNGNSLGYRGVRSIVRAIERYNYTLTSVEMLSNNGPGSEMESSDNTEEEDDPPTNGTWQENNEALKLILSRNNHLAKVTRREALDLLHISRALLLPCRRQAPFINKFTQVPIELQLHILSFLSPTLSSTQRTRIYSYASSLATLPSRLVLPRFGGIWELARSCLPDPVSLSFGNGGGDCSADKCNGPASRFVCSRQEDKMSWLAAMGCLYYEQDGDE